MSIVAQIEALVSAGGTPEQILSVLRAWEAGEAARVDCRRAKDAERKRRERARTSGMSRGVTRSHADILDGPSPSSPPSAPPRDIINPPTSPPAIPIPAALGRERDRDATSSLRQAIVAEFTRARSPNIPDTSRAAVWLAKDWRPEIIIPTIAEVLAKNPSARSLAYFEPAIAEAHAPAAARAPPAGRPPNRPLTMIDGLIAHDARQAARTDR